MLREFAFLSSHRPIEHSLTLHMCPSHSPSIACVLNPECCSCPSTPSSPKLLRRTSTACDGSSATTHMDRWAPKHVHVSACDYASAVCGSKGGLVPLGRVLLITGCICSRALIATGPPSLRLVGLGNLATTLVLGFVAEAWPSVQHGPEPLVVCPCVATCLCPACMCQLSAPALQCACSLLLHADPSPSVATRQPCNHVCAV